jgi:hypothetical protein
VKLSKDGNCDVRSSAASNPNTPDYVDKREWFITETYVATQGTTHFWYKHKGHNKPFYTAGCFIGSREQMMFNIIREGGSQYNERMQILSILDAKFYEIFNK